MKKSIFVVEEGKLLGFIVSKSGMKIKPERTDVIYQITPPNNNKNAQ